MISDSDMQCIDVHTRVTGRYASGKFYQTPTQTRKQSKLRDLINRRENWTLFSSIPDPISLRSECGLCQVCSRSGSRNMHVRKSHDGVRIGGVHTPSDELIDGYPNLYHHEEVLCR